MAKLLSKAITLILCFSHPSFAETTLEATLSPFITDGCSAFPDGNQEQNDKWLDCCIAHDLAYWQGGTYMQRLEADEALEVCVEELGESAISVIMYMGVRMGGSPYWPTDFRWGYGWPYLRGYKPLSKDEQLLIQQHLAQRQKDNKN